MYLMRLHFVFTTFGLPVVYELILHSCVKLIFSPIQYCEVSTILVSGFLSFMNETTTALCLFILTGKIFWRFFC